MRPLKAPIGAIPRGFVNHRLGRGGIGLLPGHSSAVGTVAGCGLPTLREADRASVRRSRCRRTSRASAGGFPIGVGRC